MHPPLSSHRVRLRPIAERDRGFLYDLMCAPDAGGRVRYGGATPSPEQVAASLWENVLAQFVVEGVESATPIGLVAVTTPMFRDGHAYLSAVGTPRAQGSGLVLEAVLLLCNYAFSTWPLRKLYLEATEPSYRAFRSGIDRYFSEEGRLRSHTFWNGGYVDVVITAIYRETWAKHAEEMLERLR